MRCAHAKPSPLTLPPPPPPHPPSPLDPLASSAATAPRPGLPKLYSYVRYELTAGLSPADTETVKLDPGAIWEQRVHALLLKGSLHLAGSGGESRAAPTILLCETRHRRRHARPAWVAGDAGAWVVCLLSR